MCQIVQRFVLRRKKEVAASSLTTKTELTVFCKPQQVQIDMYKLYLRRSGLLEKYDIADAVETTTQSDGDAGSDSDSERDGSADDGDAVEVDEDISVPPGGYESVLSAITALRKVCNHPDLLTSSNNTKATSSKSKKAAAAAGDSKKKSDDVMNSSGMFKNEDSGKLMILEALLSSIDSSGSGDRVVLSSNFTTTLDMFEAMCRRQSWRYLRLDGSTAADTRQALVDKFNTLTVAGLGLQAGGMTEAEAPFLFLLSAKAGGCGINLVGGNRLVLYDQVSVINQRSQRVRTHVCSNACCLRIQPCYRNALLPYR